MLNVVCVCSAVKSKIKVKVQMNLLKCCCKTFTLQLGTSDHANGSILRGKKMSSLGLLRSCCITIICTNISRDVTDSKSASKSDGIRHISRNQKSVGYLKSDPIVTDSKFLFQFK